MDNFIPKNFILQCNESTDFATDDPFASNGSSMKSVPVSMSIIFMSAWAWQHMIQNNVHTGTTSVCDLAESKIHFLTIPKSVTLITLSLCRLFNN